MLRRFCGSLAILTFSALALAGCGGPSESGGGEKKSSADAGEITIGVAAPMTGSAAAFGEMIKKASELKVKEVNAAGGINGKKVRLEIEDDKGDATEALNVARKLANNPKVCLVIGHFNSACSNAAKETYDRAKVVQFTPASTNVNVCKGSEYTFRNIYRDDYQGLFIANYAKTVLGAKRIAVLYENDDYGKGLMESFKATAPKLNLEIAGETAYYRERTQDFKSLLNPYRGQQIDLIFVAGLYNEAALIAKAARQDLQMAVPVIGGDGVMEDKFIELAGDAAEGSFVVTPFLFNTGNDTPQAKALIEKFNKEYGKDPDAWAALTYDAISQSLKAIEKVGADREAIHKVFLDTNTKEKGYDGVTGITYFDAEGDCLPKLTLVATVKGGKFVPAENQLSPDKLVGS